MEQLCRLYGYGLINSGFNALYILGVAAVPFTIWRAPGSSRPNVPSADVSLWVRVFFFWSQIFLSLVIGFNVSSREPDGRPENTARYAWAGGFVGAFLSSVFWWCAVLLVPQTLGLENPKFFFLDYVNCVVGAISGLVCSTAMQQVVFRMDKMKKENVEKKNKDRIKISKRLVKKPKTQNRTFMQKLAGNMNNLFVIFVLVV